MVVHDNIDNSSLLCLPRIPLVCWRLVVVLVLMCFVSGAKWVYVSGQGSESLHLVDRKLSRIHAGARIGDNTHTRWALGSTCVRVSVQ